MLTVCQDNIKQEIKCARFLLLITDETTDVSSTLQFLIVFWYVLPTRRPVERFWQFVEPPVHDVDPIATRVQTATRSVEGNTETKLISQSYD